MRFVELAGGEKVPALGLGTWKMGVGEPGEAEQLRALQTGIDHGMTLIDTAEMYGNGRSEQLVGKAIAGRKEKVFLVSKVLPQNASRSGTVKACEASMGRMGVEMIDLFLLHWRGPHPLADTFDGFEELLKAGKIRYFGVSNFDARDLGEVQGLACKEHLAANQVLYNLSARGIEWDLYPQCRKDNIAVMAYCPLGEGRLVNNPAIEPIARKHGVSPAAVILAFTLRLPGVISIPKSAHADRVLENAAAADLVLDADDLQQLDRHFPPPRGKRPLAMT